VLIVKFLVDKDVGAETDITNIDDKTPYDLVKVELGKIPATNGKCLSDLNVKKGSKLDYLLAIRKLLIDKKEIDKEDVRARSFEEEE
jgi:hypothetical protein